MTRISTRSILLAVVISACTAVQAQRIKEAVEPADEEQVIKIYRVVDLIVPVANYPYEGTYLPQMGTTKPSNTGSGGMMGGMGGGMFRVPDHLAQIAGSGLAGGPPAGGKTGATAFDMDQLIEAITTTVEPASWEDVGGPGTIQPIGGALAVLQSPKAQSKIEAFLEALRRESGALRLLTIHARWLLLDDEQRARLSESQEAKEPSPAAKTVDPKALAALPADAQQYAGQITCFNGQTVHIISGRLESVIGGAIPVVGGSEIGYQPIMLFPHLGVFLQLTPSALPDTGDVLLDLHNSVTHWDPPGEPTPIGSSPNREGAIEVDRINVTAQQFSTSVRVPIGKPVLVGGIGNSGQASKAKDVQQGGEPARDRAGLYLVIEVQSSGA